MLSAYLIEAHSKFEQLLLLIKVLDYPGNDIYIHVDKKSIIPKYISEYKPLHAKIVILENRYDVQWGSSTQITAEFELIKSAMSNRYYDRLHLISGVDFPIKSQEYIQQFFKNNKDKEFVHIDKVQDKKEIYKRVSKYFLFIDNYGRSKKILSFFQNVIIVFQYILGINRIKNENRIFYKGSNWFSITGNLGKYILENEEWIKKTFNKTKCCDEIFLQTLIMNSKFKDNLYYDKIKGKYSNKRYIDWKRGNPYIFVSNDYTELVKTSELFARKFDIDVDREILIKLSKLGEISNEKEK